MINNFKSSDHLTFSYKFGSFIKLDEFMDFRERLNNSLHYTATAVDRIILNFIECTSTKNLYHVNTCPRDSDIDFDALRDNHDLSAYLNWDPDHCLGPPEDSEEAVDLFWQNLGVLKLRTHIVWAVSAAIDLVRADEGSRSECAGALSKKLEHWRTEQLALSAGIYTKKEVIFIDQLAD